MQSRQISTRPVSPSLPIEVLLHLLTFVAPPSSSQLERQASIFNFGRVSRHWYYASLGSTDAFSADGISQVSQLAERLSKRYHPLKRLDISLPSAPDRGDYYRDEKPIKPSEALYQLLAQCRDLTELTIRGRLYVAVTGLRKAKHRLGGIEKLSLIEGRDGENKVISCAHLVDALSNFPKLATLIVNGCNTWDENTIVFARVHFPLLQTLSMDHIEDENSARPADPFFSSILANTFSTLTSLYLCRRVITPSNFPSLEIVAPNLIYLSSTLSLHWEHDSYHIPQFLHLVSKMVKLRQLDVESTYSGNEHQVSLQLQLVRATRDLEALERIRFGVVGSEQVRMLLETAAVVRRGLKKTVVYEVRRPCRSWEKRWEESGILDVRAAAGRVGVVLELVR